MGGAERHPRSRDDGRAVERTLGSPTKTFELQFAKNAREVAATAAIIAVTADHLSYDTEVEVAAQRFRSRAEAEREEARRVWALADELEVEGRGVGNRSST